MKTHYQQAWAHNIDGVRSQELVIFGEPNYVLVWVPEQQRLTAWRAPLLAYLADKDYYLVDRSGGPTVVDQQGVDEMAWRHIQANPEATLLRLFL